MCGRAKGGAHRSRHTQLFSSFFVAGAALNREDEDIVILSCKRTAICKAKRGGFRDTPSSDLLEAGE